MFYYAAAIKMILHAFLKVRALVCHLYKVAVRLLECAF